MHILFVFFVFAHCLLVIFSSGSDVTELSRRGSISFENADITVLIKTPNGEKVAEAFNATTDVKDLTKMRWVSLGIPRLLVRKDRVDNSKVSALKFVSGGFYIFIVTLSTEVAKELAKEASQKYEVNIKASQFLPTDKHIGELKCLLKLFLSENESFAEIIGRAEVIANPIAVFFELPHPNRKYVEIIQKLTSPIVFQCNIKLNSRYHKENLVESNSTKVEDLNLLNKLLNGGQAVVNIIRDHLLKWTYRGDVSPTFNEKISLTTEDFLVTDIVRECSEAIKANAIGEFKAVLNATAGIRDSMNQTLLNIKQMERNTSTRIDCALAMSTRDDYMHTMLHGANFSACFESSIPGAHSFAIFISNGTFTVPPGVHSLRVLAVGGGAGGGSCYAGGGGSGYVRIGELAVTPLAQIRVTVGRGGHGSTMKMGVDTQNGGGGGRSAFGSLLSADGGVAPNVWNIGGNGGSGGGAPWFSSSSGTSAAGGTDGGNGGSASGYSGGTGQGTFSQQLRVFKENTLSAGRGGVASLSGAYMGGGGGGGVLVNGEGPSGGRGQMANTFGGNGYGAGGAGGSYISDSTKGYPCYAGGNGANGLVYIEW